MKKQSKRPVKKSVSKKKGKMNPAVLAALAGAMQQGKPAMMGGKY